MALPIIPIIMAVAALGSGIVQGISSVKNAKAEAEAVKRQAEEQIAERARQAKKLMQQQKTSFLKSGVYFDSGSPLAVIDETYDFMEKDVNAMANDSNTKMSNLMRQGRTAFFGSVLQGVAEAGLAYFTGGASGALTNTGKAIKSSKLGMALQNVTGKFTGGFGSLPTSNGYTTGSTTRIV